MFFFNKQFPAALKCGLVTCIVVYCAAMTALQAQQRPLVTVQFSLQEDVYKSFYQNAGFTTAEVESAAADSVVAFLNAQLPFLQFTRAASGNTLQLILFEQSAINVGPVLHLDSGETQVADPFQFRDEFQAVLEDPPLTPGLFALALRDACVTWFNTQRDVLIRDFFGSIRVCSDAIPEAEKWVMPFTMEDLKIGARSKLQVQTTVSDTLGQEFCDFNTIAQGPVTQTSFGASIVGKMFCKIDMSGVDMECLNRIKKVNVQGVYLKQYFPLPSAQNDPLSYFSNQ